MIAYGITYRNHNNLAVYVAKALVLRAFKNNVIIVCACIHRRALVMNVNCPIMYNSV